MIYIPLNFFLLFITVFLGESCIKSLRARLTGRRRLKIGILTENPLIFYAHKNLNKLVNNLLR